jgi:NhaP-type Na+/H+ or K+/H+ antiporter
VVPELYIAPRGLVTIILFYDIPKKYMEAGELADGNFEQGMVFLTIIGTSIIMMIALIMSSSRLDEVKRKIVGR